jgi:hypothetical protein
MSGKHSRPDNDGIISEPSSGVNHFRSEFSSEMQESLGEEACNKPEEDEDEDGVQ